MIYVPITFDIECDQCSRTDTYQTEALAAEYAIRCNVEGAMADGWLIEDFGLKATCQNCQEANAEDAAEAEGEANSIRKGGGGEGYC